MACIHTHDVACGMLSSVHELLLQTIAAILMLTVRLFVLHLRTHCTLTLLYTKGDGSSWDVDKCGEQTVSEG